jgi:endo-1,4-beta-xylanase
VSSGRLLSRRSFLVGAAAALAACSPTERDRVTSRTSAMSPVPDPVECPAFDDGRGRQPLWEVALARGLVFGSSAATWQLADPEYRRLFAREAAMVFTEDDLLWWRLRPTPDAELDFRYGDRIVGFAEEQGMLVLGAHLVWDEGFGEGWTQADLLTLAEQEARDLLFGTVERVVDHYRGRVAAWIVVNEAVDDFGLRTDVPWYSTIGPGYVAEAFHLAHEADPDATLLYNDYGYETDDEFSIAADRRTATLELLDQLLGGDVPVHALGVQAHLHAAGFAEAFDPSAYRAFLSDVADRGLRILVTELDVLDDGLPIDAAERDRAVADTVGRYVDATLEEPSVAALVTFGLSDRYTWLQEDYPRDDGAPRRPLPFDEGMQPKAAYDALVAGLADATPRVVAWTPPRC